MNNTAFIYHRDYLRHFAGILHPERKERLISIMQLLEKTGILDHVDVIEPGPCTEKDLALVHSQEHIDHIRELSLGGGGPIDPDTYCATDTFELACLAAGGVMAAGETVARKEHCNSLALVRPPGHHATRDAAMRFCYFNNVAVMVKHLQVNYDIGKVSVVDWDVHHANGTSGIFYDDPSVQVVSVHQDPRTMGIKPWTGFVEEMGEGDGKGHTINIPVPVNTGDADYTYLFENFISEKIESFKPDLMVISAGFDSHKHDPLGCLGLTENGYGQMTSCLRDLAERLCDGKLIVELEGGYQLSAVAASVHRVLESLLWMETTMPIKCAPRPEIKDLVRTLRDLF